MTLADLGGYSWLSASSEDWLIPFGMLGSVISGLISHTILKDHIDIELAKQNCHDTHNLYSCLIYQHLSGHDPSVEFVDKILALMDQRPSTESTELNNEIRLTQQKNV